LAHYDGTGSEILDQTGGDVSISIKIAPAYQRQKSLYVVLWSMGIQPNSRGEHGNSLG